MASLAQMEEWRQVSQGAADFFMLCRCQLASRGEYSANRQFAEQLGASTRVKDLIKAGALNGKVRDRLRQKDHAYDPLVIGDHDSTAGLGLDLAPYQSAGGGWLASLAPFGCFSPIAAQARRFPPRVRIALTTATATASEIGEGSLKPCTSITTDSVQIDLTKVAAFLVVSDELAIRGGPEAVTLMRTELQQAHAKERDTVFLNALANSSGISTITSTGMTPTTFLEDLRAALSNITIDNASRVFLIAPPSVVAAIATMSDSSTGLLTFPTGMGIGGGSVAGITVLPSSVLSDSMVLVDAHQLGVSDELPVIEAAREAALNLSDDPTSSGSLTSLWQRNLRAVRVDGYMGTKLLRSSGAAIISSVQAVTA